MGHAGRAALGTENAALIGDDQVYQPGDYSGSLLAWDTDGWPLDRLSFER